MMILSQELVRVVFFLRDVKWNNLGYRYQLATLNVVMIGISGVVNMAVINGRRKMRYKVVNSDNGHLWYAVDEEGFICKVSLFKEQILIYCSEKSK